MALIERLQAIGTQAEKLTEHLSTEEATKMALVMPFIQALGYNVFNPQEVIPEFSADVLDRKDDKVDYAIVVDGAPSIFIECKHAGAKLEIKRAKQGTNPIAADFAQLGRQSNEQRAKPAGEGKA